MSGPPSSFTRLTRIAAGVGGAAAMVLVGLVAERRLPPWDSANPFPDLLLWLPAAAVVAVLGLELSASLGVRRERCAVLVSPAIVPLAMLSVDLHWRVPFLRAVTLVLSIVACSVALLLASRRGAGTALRVGSSTAALGSVLGLIALHASRQPLSFDRTAALYREWLVQDNGGYARQPVLPGRASLALGPAPAVGGWVRIGADLPRAQRAKYARLHLVGVEGNRLATLALNPSQPRAELEYRVTPKDAGQALRLDSQAGTDSAGFTVIRYIDIGEPHASHGAPSRDVPRYLELDADSRESWRRIEIAGETRSTLVVAAPGERCARLRPGVPANGLEVALASGLPTGEITVVARLLDESHAVRAVHRQTLDRRGWIGIDVALEPGSTLCLGAEGDPALGWSVAWSEPLPAAVRDDAEPRPNLVLISLDTVRADALGCYGRTDAKTAAVDALAARGVRFASATAAAAWTLPSHASIFTGLLPSRHGAWGPDPERRALPPDAPTVAERLRETGYVTLASTGGVYVDASFGLSRGFDRYAESLATPGGSDLQGVADTAGRLLAAAREPFFLFAHSYAAHAPYGGETKPDGRTYSTRADASRRTYHEGVDHAAKLVQHVEAELARRGALERTVIVLTSDHGEEFAEHDAKVMYDGHGHSVYEELAHVPLIAAGPGVRAGVVVREPVSLTDLAPTLLELAGSVPIAGCDGISLVEALASGDPPRRRVVICEQSAGTRSERKSARLGDQKVIRAWDAGDQLFDLTLDPFDTPGRGPGCPRDPVRPRLAVDATGARRRSGRRHRARGGRSPARSWLPPVTAGCWTRIGV